MAHPTPTTPDLEKPDFDVVHEAHSVLRDLLSSSSPEVRRKAAMDILQINNAAGKRVAVPPPTEAELEHIGRVVLEAEEIRLIGHEGER